MLLMNLLSENFSSEHYKQYGLLRKHDKQVIIQRPSHKLTVGEVLSV